MIKKIFLTFCLLLFMFLSINTVNAEESYTIYELSYLDFVPLNSLTSSAWDLRYNDKYLYNDFNSFYKDEKNKQIFDDLYDFIINFYNSNYSTDFPYYQMEVIILSSSHEEFKLYGVFVNMYLSNLNDFYSSEGIFYPDYKIYSSYVLGTYHTPHALLCNSTTCSLNSSRWDYYWELDYLPFVTSAGSYAPTLVFERNFSQTFQYSQDEYYVYDDNSSLLLEMTAGDEIPYFREPGIDLSSYDTVNLDNYYYVILSLKDYSVTSSFTSDMFVKGMIGITPVYNYGTTEKSTITDRCNISYSDFTRYRVSVLQSDLTNKSVFYVKSCQDNSSFKYDTNIFDITYITDDNKDNPVITVNGNNYTTIPFDNLTNSANENEENDFVPGESSNFIDSVGDIASNIGDYLSSLIGMFTSFMSFVTQLFNTLPIEIRALSISVFTLTLVLGVVKFIKS